MHYNIFCDTTFSFYYLQFYIIVLNLFRYLTLKFRVKICRLENFDCMITSMLDISRWASCSGLRLVKDIFITYILCYIIYNVLHYVIRTIISSLNLISIKLCISN